MTSRKKDRFFIVVILVCLAFAAAYASLYGQCIADGGELDYFECVKPQLITQTSGSFRRVRE